MAKITDLDPASALDGTEEFETIQGGVSKRVTADAIGDSVLPQEAYGIARRNAGNSDWRTDYNVETLGQLQGLSPSDGDMAFMAGRDTIADAGAGKFVFQGGNQSSNVTADPDLTEWVPPTSDATGASGAWQRIPEGAARISTLSELQDAPAGAAPFLYLLGRASEGDGAQGPFRWVSGNQSTNVSNDEVSANEGDGGIWVAPTSDKTGASGAWVRLTQHLEPEFYGANNNADSAAFLAMIATAKNDSLPIIAYNTYDIDAQIDFREVELQAGAAKLDVSASGIGVILGGNSNNSNNPEQRVMRIQRDGGVTSTPTARVIGAKGQRLLIDECDYLQFFADSDDSAGNSCGYSEVFGKRITKLELTTNMSPSTGAIQWINENTFHLKRTNELVVDGINNVHNNNYFHNGTFEGNATINFQNGRGNYVFNARSESGLTVTFASGTEDNVVTYGWISSGHRWFQGPTVNDSGEMNTVMHALDHLVREETLIGFDYQSLKNPSSTKYNVQGAKNTTINASDLTVSTDTYFYQSPRIPASARKTMYEFDVFGLSSGGIRVRVDGFDSAGSKITPGSADVKVDGTGEIGFETDSTSINTDNNIRLWILNENAATIRFRVRAGGSGATFESFTLMARFFDRVQREKALAAMATQQSGLDESGWGNASVSPDANGNATIAHGLSSTPSVVLVGIRGDNVNGVDAESVDGTNITVRIKDASGSDVTSGTFTVDWYAQV